MTLIVVSLISGCTKDKGIVEENYVLPDTVHFATDILPVFSAYCTTSGCHSGSTPAAALDLTPVKAYKGLFRKNHLEVDTVQPDLSVLYIEMNTEMPPSGKLSQYNIQLVYKWIQQKAKNN